MSREFHWSSSVPMLGSFPSSCPSCGEPSVLPEGIMKRYHGDLYGPPFSSGIVSEVVEGNSCFYQFACCTFRFTVKDEELWKWLSFLN